MGGTGTSSDPYLIKSSADWKELATQVASGNSYIGKYFMMSDDLNTDGVQVGSKETPFSGTFDGDGHTLTYNKSNPSAELQCVDEECAPFGCLSGATVRHLRTTGEVNTKNRYNGGVAVPEDGYSERRVRRLQEPQEAAHVPLRPGRR